MNLAPPRYASLYFLMCTDVDDNELVRAQRVDLRDSREESCFSDLRRWNSRAFFSPGQITLEIIQQYVEVLDRYFGNVCELDLIFDFHKACVCK